MDGPSSDALTFAARRLDAEGTAIIFAARDHDTPFHASGLSVLRIGGLDPASAAALLDEHGDGLTPAARSQILAEACGNPLGRIELPAAYLTTSHAAEQSGCTTLALTERLQHAFEGRVRRLPADAQTMLLIAASESSGDLDVLVTAAEMLAVTPTALERAEQARLIDIAMRP